MTMSSKSSLCKETLKSSVSVTGTLVGLLRSEFISGLRLCSFLTWGVELHRCPSHGPAVIGH